MRATPAIDVVSDANLALDEVCPRITHTTKLGEAAALVEETR